MSYEDRVRLVILVDTALAMSSLEIGLPPRLSFDLYTGARVETESKHLAYQVNHNDAPQFDRGLAPLIEDPEMRDLLASALAELTRPHVEFQRQMLAPESRTELDEQIAQRGLTGRGLDLKEGGQRKAIDEYRQATTWLSRRKWFRSALKWTDIVLGSLSSIPVLGVAVDPLKEWKEAVEAQLDVESGRRRKK